METSKRIIAIYDAAFSKDRWQSALDAVQIGTDSVGMMFYDVSKNRPVQYGATGTSSSYSWVSEHFPDYNRLVSDPSQGTGLDDEGSRFMHRQPAFKPVPDDAVWKVDSAFMERPEIRFTRQRMKFFRRFFVNLSEDPTSFAALLTHYSLEHDGPPKRNDMKHVEALAPHFGKALELHRSMHALRQKHNAALAALDSINVAVCILQDNGQIVLKNSCAEVLFSKRDGIWMDRFGQLACASRDETEKLRHATTRISGTAAGQNSDRAHRQAVARKSGAQPLFAVVSPLRDADMELERGLSGALVTILDGSTSNRLDPELFKEAFGLTEAETRILPSLLSGSTNEEMAREADVSRETIKSHVSSILSKTGSKNRLLLLWRVFQWSPPIL